MPRQKWLSSRVVSETVIFIERHLPGWWYSISQKAISDEAVETILQVKISLGASSSCPDAESLYLASTKEGDKGSFIDLSLDPGNISNDLYILNLFKESIRLIEEEKNSNIPDKTDLFTENCFFSREQMARVHTHLEVGSFERSYRDLVTYLDEMVVSDNTEDPNVSIEELYVGSCTLSVDTSIRGTLRGTIFDGTFTEPFDIRNDLTGNATLGDSIRTSLKLFQYCEKHALTKE